MGFYNFMNNLGKRAEEKRQLNAVLEEKAKHMHEEAAKAEKRHQENKEQGMI